MREKIKQLEDRVAEKDNKSSEPSFRYAEPRSEKYEAQETKIQTLIELLETAQQEISKLR